MYKLNYTEGYRSLVCQGKYMPNALKENAEKQWNQNWKMVSAVFVRIAALLAKSPRRSKSLRNLWSLAKSSLHALSILKKHMTEFLGINFGRLCGSMVLKVSC